jgi:hypothetical protein
MKVKQHKKYALYGYCQMETTRRGKKDEDNGN